MHVAALAETHVPAYRELMLEAYEQAADAFTTTAEERRAEPLSWWVKRVGSETGLSRAFGAWSGPELVGSVALEFTAEPKTRHSALVLGMYVKPKLRGRGVGKLLVHVAIDSASSNPGLRVLTLTLTEGNDPALRLYKAAGFVVWGTEPLAIHTPAGFKGKVHMAKVLHHAGAAA